MNLRTLPRIPLLAVVFLLLSSVSADGQETTGQLRGRILTSDDEPLVAANVAVEGPSLMGQTGAFTDTDGNFIVHFLPPGAYKVTISYMGYRTLVIEEVLIQLGKTKQLGEVRLEQQAREMEPITVIDERQIIDNTTASIGENIASSFFGSLPDPYRGSFRHLGTLLPQVNTSYYGDDANIAGSTGIGSASFIDGMNVTDPYKAVGGIDLPYNFIKEIEVRTGGYEAEYGRSFGGIINAITYSGGNEYHGSFFSFFADNRLAADHRRGLVELNTGGFSRYDAGASLGGPVIRDKLWFFLAYNRNYENEDIELPGIGIRADRSATDLFAGKLTWRPSSRTNLMLTILGDPSERDRIGHSTPLPYTPSVLLNADPFLGKWYDGGTSLSVQGTHVAGRNLILEGSVSRLDTRTKTEPATERGRTEATYVDLTTATWSGGYGVTFDHHSIRTAAKLMATYFLKDHQIKAGLEYEDNLMDEEWLWQSDQAGGAGMVLKAAPSFYLAWPLDYRTDVRSEVLTCFGQGSFSLSPRLLLNVGLRWDGQYFRGVSSGLEGDITDQLQPRAGFVYQIGELGTKKISGSFGRFYEQVPLLFAVNNYGGLQQERIVYDHDPIVDPTGGFAFTTPKDLDENMRGQHFDEIVLGYERLITERFSLSVRGIYRTTREVIATFKLPSDTTGTEITGNPGRGKGSVLPDPVRRYSGLEFTLRGSPSDRVRILASYVLSRNYGNYPGLANQDWMQDLPHMGLTFINPDQFENAMGLLPNDRTHVFKFSGSYRTDSGIHAGLSFLWQSGTPLNEFGSPANPIWKPGIIFLKPRGSVGRTPSITDLNLRLTYDLSNLLKSSYQTRLVVDALHVLNRRTPVMYGQQHYNDAELDGNQISPDPNYGLPILFQLPRTVRIGLEIHF